MYQLTWKKNNIFQITFISWFYGRNLKILDPFSFSGNRSSTTEKNVKIELLKRTFFEIENIFKTIRNKVIP